MSNNIIRDLSIGTEILNFIIENIPNGGYALVGKKLGHTRRFVRDEVLVHKLLYNFDIINGALELIKFESGKTLSTPLVKQEAI